MLNDRFLFKIKRIINIFALFLVLLLMVSCDEEKEAGGLAPNLASDEQLAEFENLNDTHENRIQLENSDGADPFVLRYNGMYYLYVTTGGKSIRGYKSSDMYSWEMVDNGLCDEGYVYQYSLDDNAPTTGTPYAPEVFYFNGYFYLSTSPSGKGHYILRSSSPEGPFENISGNIGLDIDGHYFIDGKDEKLYLYASGSSGIMCYEMEDDMFSVKKDEGGNEKSTIYLDAKVGNWNEGPYMLQRNGNYYLTYCGTHFLSASYRVDYAYADSTGDLMAFDSFYKQDTLLLSTTDTFRGLGHSSTVLGPDMDSYYIVYHNLEPNNSRRVNYSRLSFNGSVMVANDVKEADVIKASLPSFSTYGEEEFIEEGNFILSDKSTNNTFTVEFNTTGEGKMIFSYVDSSNYSFIEYKDNSICIKKIENDKEQLIQKIALLRNYSSNVNHTFRLQYKDKKLSFYFDNVEKAYDVDCSFEKGKIGFIKGDEFINIGYVAFSDVALGSSDNKAYNDSVSLANTFDYELSYLTGDSQFVDIKNDYDESDVDHNCRHLLIANKGNRATYRTNLSGSKYSIELVVPSSSLGKRVGVRIDNNEIIEVTIPNNIPTNNPDGNVQVSLGVFDIAKGQHNISIYNVGDTIQFSEVIYNKISDEKLSVDFDTQTDISSYFIKGNITLNEDGLKIENSSVAGFVCKGNYFNKTYSTKINIKQISITGYIGLVFNCNAYSNYPSADADKASYAYPYSGYLLSIDRYGVSLMDVRFNDIIVLNEKSYQYKTNEDIYIKVVQNNNQYIVYIDDVEMFKVNANVFNLSGSVGVFSKNAETIVRSIKVE